MTILITSLILGVIKLLHLQNKYRFEIGMRVLYTQTGDRGVVSSIGDNYIFVKFDHLIPDKGLDDMNGQACHPENLDIIMRYFG